ncbi:MAG: hypothetical protein B7Z73_12690 [Planctomycetia bacterium 21-64-5]|nr:MAG: hypothetical protein B7Z73_12690 [Planctomycetia bacterium 21-64-5]HQU44861.1 hypothetical protein [Pirellulales bacterium]
MRLFSDQSKNLRSIDPFNAEFRLMANTTPASPFVNHATDLLDFTAGEVQIVGAPSGDTTYNAFTSVPFLH